MAVVHVHILLKKKKAMVVNKSCSLSKTEVVIEQQLSLELWSISINDMLVNMLLVFCHTPELSLKVWTHVKAHRGKNLKATTHFTLFHSSCSTCPSICSSSTAFILSVFMYILKQKHSLHIKYFLCVVIWSWSSLRLCSSFIDVMEFHVSLWLYEVVSILLAVHVSLVGCCYSMYIKCPAMLASLSFGKSVCCPSNTDSGSMCLCVQMKTWPRKLNINLKIDVTLVDSYFNSKFSVWSLCYYFTIGFNAMSTSQDPKTCWTVWEISFFLQLLCGMKENN